MLGVSPDYRVAINRELLEEVDGPMLRHGLQEMHGRAITLPARRTDRPDQDLLAWRWERFAGQALRIRARSTTNPSGSR